MKFHRVTITFDRVFDVVRFRGYETPPHTLFGFQASTGKFHAVRVPGSPQILAGDTVTALLSKQNDWQTLRGWINHQTGEIAAPSAGGGYLASAAMFITAGFCLYLTWFSVSSLMAVPFLIGGSYWLRYAIAAIAIRKTLQRNGTGLGAAQ